ncbi:Site-specific recombinase [Pseudomonas syringae pv. maculicola]|nr:hypothetical protein [Pseudomonas syringae group genomosp. 3]KPB95402.1 Site-specific recombinase [Pseudomonas syringae pv. maculicola]
MDQYFIEEEELEARLEEGMPIVEYRQAKKALRESSKKDMEIAKRRESSLG